MYPIHFYLCLVASVILVVGLILLAVFPIKLPLTPVTQTKPKVRPRKARSPTRSPTVITDDWDDDEDDL